MVLRASSSKPFSLDNESRRGSIFPHFFTPLWVEQVPHAFHPERWLRFSHLLLHVVLALCPRRAIPSYSPVSMRELFFLPFVGTQNFGDSSDFDTFNKRHLVPVFQLSLLQLRVLLLFSHRRHSFFIDRVPSTISRRAGLWLLCPNGRLTLGL